MRRISAPRPAAAGRPPRGSRKVAKPHFLERNKRRGAARRQVHQRRRGRFSTRKTHASMRRQQTAPRHPQVGQRKQRVELRGVFLEPAVAHLDVAELALNDPKRLLHLGPDAGLDSLHWVDESIDQSGLVQCRACPVAARCHSVHRPWRQAACPHLTAPGFVEARWVKSGHHRGGLIGELPVVVCLNLGRRDAADGFEQAMVVEPGYPFQRGQFERRFGLPRRATVNQLGLVEPVDRLGQRVVVAVALAPTEGSTPASARRSL